MWYMYVSISFLVQIKAALGKNSIQTYPMKNLDDDSEDSAINDGLRVSPTPPPAPH